MVTIEICSRREEKHPLRKVNERVMSALLCVREVKHTLSFEESLSSALKESEVILTTATMALLEATMTLRKELKKP
jgi:hypothetical protein